MSRESLQEEPKVLAKLLELCTQPLLMHQDLAIQKIRMKLLLLDKESEMERLAQLKN